MWTNFPVTDGVDVQSYPFLNQLWKAVQERVWRTGANVWPQSSFQWTTGQITGLSANGDGTYTLNSSTSQTANRWFNHTPVQPYEPRFYDLIIDDPHNETLCLHAKILGNTTSTFQIADPNWAAGSHLPDIFVERQTERWFGTPNVAALVSSLVGKNYYVVQSSGEWWHERWLIWPNDQQAALGKNLTAGAVQKVTSLTSSSTTATAVVPGHGFITGDTVTIAGATPSAYNGSPTVTVIDANTFTYSFAGGTSPATGSITATCTLVGAHDASQGFPVGKYASGYELMVGGSDATLKRITLTGNDGSNLFFARLGGGLTVSGQYAVIAAGKKWRFYKTNHSPATLIDTDPTSAGLPYRWYCPRMNIVGTNTYWSRYPDDSVVATPVPTPTVNLLGGAMCSTPVPITAFNADVWTDFNDTCNPPDENYTPDYFRTPHALQVELENLCTFYVIPDSYEGNTHQTGGPLIKFVPATLFLYCAINTTLASTGTVDVGGGGVAIAGGVPAGYVGINGCHFAMRDSNGVAVIWGTGVCDTTTHFTVQTIFGAANLTGVSPGSDFVISPGWTRTYENCFMYMYDKQCWIPGTSGGVLVNPPTSATPGQYVLRQKSTTYREVDAMGFVRNSNGSRSFVDGDFVRYKGDNYNDPSIHVTGLGGPDTEISTSDTSTPRLLWNNFYEGMLNPTAQAALKASKSGTVTTGTTTQLQDTGKNWWTGGVLHTESGTADSGSTTSLGDSSKSGNGFWTTGARCLLGFVVEITQGGVTYRRPISAFFGGTTISWTEPLPASANGCAYQIRMPAYEVNRWGNRTLNLTLPDGTQHNGIAIQNSDDNSLYFAAQAFTISPGTTYKILEYYPGGVWQRQNSGSKWIVPAGNDPRTGVAWHPNQNENCPTFNTSYGYFNKGDVIGGGFTVLNELYTVIQALQGVAWNTGWQGPGPNNDKFGEASAELCFDTGIPSSCPGPYARPDAKTTYGSSGTAVNAHPFALSYTEYNCACYTYALGRRFANGTASGINTYQNSDLQFWVYSLVPTDLHDGGGGTTTAGSCPAIEAFDAMGDSVTYQSWHNFDTQGGNSNSRTSVQLGSLSTPTDIGPAPATCSGPGMGFCSWMQGYTIASWTGVLKGNVAGGFVYQ